MIESAWLGPPDGPRTPPPTLTAAASGHPGGFVLEWTLARAGAGRWQYRQWGPDEGAWGAWRDVTGSDASTTRHRITGLKRGAPYRFEVRLRPEQAGVTYDAVEATALEGGSDDIPRAVPGQALEEGRRFRVGETRYTFRVPARPAVRPRQGVADPLGIDPDRWTEPGSGSAVTYDVDWGIGVEFSYRYPVPAGLRALFDQLLESIRE